MILPKAKNSDRWTSLDLDYFKIRVVGEDAQTLFGMPELPTPDVSSAIWNSEEIPAGSACRDDARFFDYLAGAMTRLTRYSQPCVCSFVGWQLGFKVLGFDGSSFGVMRMREVVSFPMCGEEVRAEIDFAVTEQFDSDHLQICMIGKDDKSNIYINYPEPEPHLIAHTIAAFHENNRTRTEVLGLPPLTSMTFPAFIVLGTCFDFYKITVTEELAKAVELGVCPQNLDATVVKKCVPPWVNIGRYRCEGMVNRVERRGVLMCLEACKRMASELSVQPVSFRSFPPRPSRRAVVNSPLFTRRTTTCSSPSPIYAPTNPLIRALIGETMSIDVNEAIKAIREMLPIIDPEEDYLTIVAAEEKIIASETKRKKELEEAHAKLKALTKIYESARISSTRPASVPSQQAHVSLLNELENSKLSLAKAISDAESLAGSKDAELAALREEARALEAYDPAAEHAKELDGSVLRLQLIKGVGEGSTGAGARALGLRAGY
ncbi:hypothetical protein NMY22_g4282 [Coprinellus aureogranulatus]|nr:hypothetical protein NMY22_g4282 [Coprinellus aureogranulatus]